MQKSEILEFLTKIDTHLAENFEQVLREETFSLRIIGKCSLLLSGMTDPIGTVDLDSLEIETKSTNSPLKTIATKLLDTFGRKQQNVHGYYLEFVGEAMVFLPRRPRWHTLTGDWKHLTIQFLDPNENIASKCFSAFSTPPRKKDLKDITEALDQKLVTLPKVLELVDQIFDLYSMDARSDRFPHIYSYITNELIPNYGGGRLKYRPEVE